MLRRARLVGQLWRWHRRAGLLAALFLLLMSLSGIVLNHGDDLALEQRFVASAWLRAIYGDTDSGWAAFRASGHWVLGDQGGRIFLDVREVARCNGALQGVVELAGMLLLGCERELLLLGTEGELIDSIAATAALSGLGLADGEAVVHIAGRWRAFDPASMRVGDEVADPQSVVDSQPQAMPEAFGERPEQRSAWLNWERALLDFHSGRLFGRAGVWLVDIAGVLLCILALSGVTLWWLHRKRSD